MFLWEPPDDLFPSRDDLFRLTAVMAMAAFVFLTCNFVFTTRLPTPFCDTGLDSSDFLSDNCEPCPSNGKCYQGKLECVRGYRKQGNICVEDGDISQTVKKLSQWVQLRLCESYAQYLCGGAGMIWVCHLRNLRFTRMKYGVSWMCTNCRNMLAQTAVNSYTKNKAMEAVVKVLETRTNALGVRELKCQDVLAESYKPFSCRVHQWISNNVLVILPTCLLGNLYNQRLSTAKVTLSGPNPWPFNDGVVFFKNSTENYEDVAIPNGNQSRLSESQDSKNDLATVAYDENLETCANTNRHLSIDDLGHENEDDLDCAGNQDGPGEKLCCVESLAFELGDEITNVEVREVGYGLRKRRKSFSDPEDSTENLSNQYDSMWGRCFSFCRNKFDVRPT